jgi:hypothetical protein
LFQLHSPTIEDKKQKDGQNSPAFPNMAILAQKQHIRKYKKRQFLQDLIPAMRFQRRNIF